MSSAAGFSLLPKRPAAISLVNRILHLALDLFPFPPIIVRNHKPMNPSLFSLSLIVILISVLIIKDLLSVRMATVRVK